MNKKQIMQRWGRAGARPSHISSMSVGESPSRQLSLSRSLPGISTSSDVWIPDWRALSGWRARDILGARPKERAGKRAHLERATLTVEGFQIEQSSGHAAPTA